VNLSAGCVLSSFIDILYRVIHTVHIQIPALHDCGDFGSVCAGTQTQCVLPLVDLSRIITIDRIGGRPVGILLGEPSDSGIVVPRAEVVGFCFLVEVLTAVAEWVGIAGAGVLLVAESVVIVALFQRAAVIGKRDHIAVGVMEIILNALRRDAGDQVDTPGVDRRQHTVRTLTHHIAAIQQEVSAAICRALGCANAGGVVGVGRGSPALLQNGELVEAVVIIQLGTIGIALLQEIAIRVVGVDGGGGSAARGLLFLRQTVVLVVGVAAESCNTPLGCFSGINDSPCALVLRSPESPSFSEFLPQ